MTTSFPAGPTQSTAWKLLLGFLGILMFCHYFIISQSADRALDFRNRKPPVNSDRELSLSLPNNLNINLQLSGDMSNAIKQIFGQQQQQQQIQAQAYQRLPRVITFSPPDGVASGYNDQRLSNSNGYWFGSIPRSTPFRPETIDEYTHLFSEKSPRIAIITYVPHRDDHFYVMQYTAILYSSWRYIIDHPSLATKAKFKNHTTLTSDLVIADMLVFCAPQACKELPVDCIKFVQGDNPRDPLEYPMLHKCYYFESLEHPYAKDYGWTNSFIFYAHQDYISIQNKYAYIFRLDTDCFVTPPFLSYVPPPDKNIIMEYWSYCTDFNMKRLEYIAKKLGLKNQKVHCIGSSFYVRPDLMAEVAPLTLNLTIHIAKREFDKSLPGLESIFKDNSNPEGIWPTWWRGVSLLYGTELALNHVVPKLEEGWVDGLVDEGTCENTNIMSMVQLHSFQGACQFRKFDFMDAIRSIRLNTRILDPRLLIYYDDRDVTGMSQREYAQFIAWSGAGRYIREIRGWTAVVLGHEEPNPYQGW